MTANANGTWNSSIQYTAFGEIRATSGLTATKYRYTGQLAQDVLGLDYYVARYYDPQIGHFTQADTIIPNSVKSLSFDRYSYSRNNPVRYNDPSGHGERCGLGDHCTAADRSADLRDAKAFQIIKNTHNNNNEDDSSDFPVNTWDPNTDASDDIIEDIRNWEGYEEFPYDNDGSENCTVGIGHLLHFGACSAQEKINKYTAAKIEEFFIVDLANAEKDVRQMFQDLDNYYNPDKPNGNPFPITQAQFDALVSYTFNAGSGSMANLISESIVPETGTFDYQVFTKIMKSDIENEKAPGLKPRRLAEFDLFFNGKYP
ncbi:MAG: RHS repeat-associated core domain-containing protein [Anaerolineaceae bacterium]